jgi:hypothetical protein
LPELREIGLFESLAGVTLEPARRPMFAACFYFETAVDQGLHMLHPDAHARFQAAHTLPKLGRLGMGTHIDPPDAFLGLAKREWGLSDGVLEQPLEGAGDLVITWAQAFFAEHEIAIDVSELLRTIADHERTDRKLAARLHGALSRRSTS